MQHQLPLLSCLPLESLVWMINRILDGKDKKGTFGDKKLQALRVRLVELTKE